MFTCLPDTPAWLFTTPIGMALMTFDYSSATYGIPSAGLDEYGPSDALPFPAWSLTEFIQRFAGAAVQQREHAALFGVY